MMFLLALEGVRTVDFDGCAFGLRPPGWSASHGDVRIQNPTRIVTNIPHLEIMRRKCSSIGPHKHERAIAWHDREGASHTKHSGAYPVSQNQMYARALVTAWKEGFAPKKHALPYVPLERLQSNVGVEPKVLFPKVPAVT